MADTAQYSGASEGQSILTPQKLQFLGSPEQADIVDVVGAEAIEEEM